MKGSFMKKSRFLLEILSVILLFALIVISIISIDFKDVFVRAATFTLSPKVWLSEDLASDNASTEEFYFESNKPATDTSVETSARLPVSQAVSKTVIGNIIKRTVSPYGANTSFSNVYINNKCGKNIDILNLLSSDLPYTVEKNDEPQVLIYHTHATESYFLEDKSAYTEEDNTRTTDNTKNVIAVGDRIAEQLENAGYRVIHDTTLHDYPGYTGSYTRSAETVKKILKEYPSIKIAIDVHRDSIASSNNGKIAPVVSVNGKEAAQIMLVMGSQTGSISGHPNWQENLKLATKLQYVFESTYPSLARPILLKSAKYNQHLTLGSILLEMGSDANTLEQALYSGELAGKAIVTLLESGKG